MIRLSQTVMVEVYDKGHTIHHALARTLADVAAASQGKEFLLFPPKDREEAKVWDKEYESRNNMIALGVVEE